MIKLLNSFTVNLAMSYVKFTYSIIFDSSEIALKIKRVQHLEVSPFNYVRQGVVCIIGIWLLGYLITRRITSGQSLVFSMVIGIYFINKVILFAVVLWFLRVGNKPMSFTLKAYSCIVGAFAPIAIALIEFFRIYYIYSKHQYIDSIEKMVIIIFDAIAVCYLYKFMRIIHELKSVRFIIAIIIYSLISVEVVDNLFLHFIDLIKAQGLM